MKLPIALLALAGVWCAAGQTPEISKLRAEPDPVRRARMALDSAENFATASREAYEAARFDDFRSALKNVVESVDLMLESLRASGGNPHKNPRFWKPAEIRMRALARRLGDLAKEVSVSDRPAVERARDHSAGIHDQMLAAIMGGKSK